jgi:pectinesterase
MKNFFLLSLLIFAEVFAQHTSIIKDTSFNTKSTAAKIAKDYPHAKVVNALVPEYVTAKYNVEYAVRGNRKLKMDIFLPARGNNKNFPFVMIMHGGGWRSGDKSMEWPTAIYLAKNGYVAATVEYRLSGEAKYPAAVYDLKEAIRWIRKNAKEFEIDTNRIAVSGTSAGGELAAFLGTTGGIRKFEGDGDAKNFSSSVHAVVDIDGIVDFKHPAESGKDTDPLKPSAGKAWFGASFKENSLIWEEASPIVYVNEKTPPILFINSSLDRYHAGRDEMITKLNKLNIYSEVHTIPETPHPFWLFHPWFDEAMTYMLNFLNKVFKTK